MEVIREPTPPPPEPIRESYIYRYPYGFIGLGNGAASPVEMEVQTEEEVDIDKPLTFDPMHPGLENLSPRQFEQLKKLAHLNDNDMTMTKV